MNRVKKCGRVYLSCNTKMEFFSMHGCNGIRIKIIDLASGHYVVLWDHEVYQLICQIVAYESVQESHPKSWTEYLCQTFSIKRYLQSSKYILLTQYRKGFILDRQCIATLIEMHRDYKTFITSMLPETLYNMDPQRFFKE